MNVKKEIFRQAIVMQMTMRGAPTIYYGDEAGLCGWTDPDSRRTYPWGRENRPLIDFHKDIIHIHNRYEALRTGSLKFLHGEHRLIAYGRFNDDHAIAVIINNDFVDKEVKLHVRELGVRNNRLMKRVLKTAADGYDLSEETYMVQNNVLTVVVPKGSASIYVCNLGVM